MLRVRPIAGAVEEALQGDPDHGALGNQVWAKPDIASGRTVGAIRQNRQHAHRLLHGILQKCLPHAKTTQRRSWCLMPLARFPYGMLQCPVSVQPLPSDINAPQNWM